MTGKVILMVMDSVGIGALPDAGDYGDIGSDTLGNIIGKRGSLRIPNLIHLGLGNIQGVNIPYCCDHPAGAFGKAAAQSKGKDTTTGHWEIAGVVLQEPFPVYPDGFPDAVIKPFKDAIGRDILWNKTASGSEIINRLGEEHERTGFPIVYTSADSVFQIAAHESVIPIETLYEYCRIARSILQGPHGVGRVIARPFNGFSGSYARTKNRRDFSLPPSGPTILDHLQASGIETAGVGKISDIFTGRGLQRSVPTKSNEEGIEATLSLMAEDFSGLIFTNLVDFDMIYGHRNDVSGYAEALEALDRRIPDLLDALGREDVLILTADHGCDPTTDSTDHSREYIPILLTGDGIKKGVDLGIQPSFSDIGATVLDLLGAARGDSLIQGTSFYNKLK